MTRDNLTRRIVLKLAGAGLGAAALGGVASGDELDPVDDDTYIVGLEADTAVETVTDLAESVNHQLDFDDIGRVVSGTFDEETVERLRSDPDVRYVEKNGRMKALGETVPYGIELTDADDAIDEGETGDGVSIAILDTGIDSTHETLETNLGNGWAADGAECGSGGGWPFSADEEKTDEELDGDDCDEDWDDVQGHGTHVAGTAAAAMNGIGVKGVAPDATLHSVKVLDDSGGGDFDDIAAGIEWAADQGHEVINMSLGGPESAAVSDACDYAATQGVVLVAAAGNDGPCTDCVGSPADHPEVIAVSATDENDDLASFSSTGPEIEIAAPGADVLSSVPGDDYDEFSGTSMASPHVAGAAASVIASGTTDREDVRDALKDNAEDIGLGDNEQGSGRLNVLDAVDDDDDDDDPDPPDVSIDIETDPATDVDETTATLNGELVDFDDTDEVEVWFEYGTVGSGFPNSTASTTFDDPGPFSSDVSGLSDGTSYEFRAVGEADDVEETGGVETFTTDEDDDGGCFITTATARDDATLDSLRRFRDDSMAATPLGRGMVGLYYRISPPIADTLARHPDSTATGVTRRLVEICASLSDRQEETDSRVASASLGVALTGLYVVGIVTGGAGHAGLRLREFLSRK